MESTILITTVPAILALVNLAKKLGLDGQKSLVLSVALGVVLNVANYYLAEFGGYQSAIDGLLIGLAAAGFYDLAKTASTTYTIAVAPEPKDAKVTKLRKK